MLAELNHEDTNVQKVFLNWFSEATETIRAARALVPEHMWIGYENLQVTGLREQDIFYAARKAVVILFKDRHESFKLQRKTNARVTSESSDECSVNPGGSSS